MELAAAIIGVADVALRASSKLWKLSATWRDAPAEIHGLRDDVTRTENFFCEIQQSIKIVGWVTHPNLEGQSALHVDLAELIEEGAATLRRIEAIVDGLDAPVLSGETSNSNMIWNGDRRKRLLWLRNSMKVAKLRKELCHIRSSICRLLIAQNVSLSTKIYISLENLQVSQVETVPLVLGISQNALVARLDRRLEDMESNLITAFRQETSEARLGNAPTKFKANETPDEVSRCNIDCNCLCHYPASISWRLAPQAAQNLTGIFELSYSSWSSQPCTNATCRRIQRVEAGRDIRVVYQFPDWLARISISAFFSSSVHGHPQFNLRMHNRRSMAELQNSEGVAWLIVRGDAEGVQRALQEGRASIYDVFGPALLSPLRIAIGRNNHAVAKLLLQAGADPFEKPDPVVGRSAIEIAFQLYVAGDSVDKETAALFPLTRYMEEGEFSPLHLAILEILQMDLATALQKPEYKDHVNRRSADGWVPVHLAALRGDVVATKLLVQAGADVNIQTPQGTTPLFFACLYGHCSVVEALLQAGANLEDRDTFGRTALHGAAMCKTGTSPRLISILARHGAVLNSLDCDGGSALRYIISWNGNTDALKFLLKNGLNPEHIHLVDGSSVIIDTIWAASHRVAEILLSHGCDIAVRTTDGRGLLHHLAVSRDVEMLSIFAKNKAMRRLSTSARDNDGKTPLQLFNDQAPDPELRSAFENLLESVERHRDEEKATMAVDDASDDEFFDASDGSSEDLPPYTEI